MIAEIYGKVTGCSRGKGGSMHLIDESVGLHGLDRDRRRHRAGRRRAGLSDEAEADRADRLRVPRRRGAGDRGVLRVGELRGGEAAAGVVPVREQRLLGVFAAERAAAAGPQAVRTRRRLRPADASRRRQRRARGARRAERRRRCDPARRGAAVLRIRDLSLARALRTELRQRHRLSQRRRIRGVEAARSGAGAAARADRRGRDQRRRSRGDAGDGSTPRSTRRLRSPRPRRSRTPDEAFTDVYASDGRAAG